LPPHYRDVIVRRFLDGTKPADIAGDLGRPVESVRTRLRRALQLLRAELDERTDGGRKSWGAALLPLLPAPTAKAATLGVIGMGVRSKLAIVALLLLAIGISVERVVRFGDAATPSRRIRAATNADPQPATQAATVATPPARGNDAAQPKGKYRITTGCPGARVTVRFHHYGGTPDPSAQTLIADESGVVSCDPPAHPQPLHHISAEARAPGGGRAAGTLPLEDPGKALLDLPVRGGAQTVRGVVVDPDGMRSRAPGSSAATKMTPEPTARSNSPFPRTRSRAARTENTAPGWTSATTHTGRAPSTSTCPPPSLCESSSSGGIRSRARSGSPMGRPRKGSGWA